MKIPDPFSYKLMGVPRTEADIKFDTYQNYLSCIRQFIEKKYQSPKDLIESIINTVHLEQLSNLDEKVLRRFLYIGWNTEFLLDIRSVDGIDFLKISNQWGPIQAYYAIYSVGEALAYVIDRRPLESHSGCLEKLNRFLIEKVKTEPWSLGYLGTTRRGFTRVNFPRDSSPVSNLKRKGVSNFEMIATCLLAEHRNLIEEFTPRKLTARQRVLAQKK